MVAVAAAVAAVAAIAAVLVLPPKKVSPKEVVEVKGLDVVQQVLVPSVEVEP